MLTLAARHGGIRWLRSLVILVSRLLRIGVVSSPGTICVCVALARFFVRVAGRGLCPVSVLALGAGSSIPHQCRSSLHPLGVGPFTHQVSGNLWLAAYSSSPSLPPWSLPVPPREGMGSGHLGWVGLSISKSCQGCQPPGSKRMFPRGSQRQPLTGKKY